MFSYNSNKNMDIATKLRHLNWGFVILLCLLAAVGVAMLYSAGNNSWDRWAKTHMIRWIPCLTLMLMVAMVNIRVWLRWAYLIYLVVLLMLVGVEVAGTMGMGAERWIALGPVTLQPSELMKIALALALARYFHGLTIEQIGKPLLLIPPLFLILMPVALVLHQPNLGTATLLVLASGAMFFAAGVRIWKFLLVIVAGGSALPVAWNFLKPYQQGRVLTFLEPERDPLGAGYNIIQSKIALGSGGVFGKGYGLGSQGQLMFLPERHTDFIFVMLAEEMGLIGGLAVLFLYFLVFAYGYYFALVSRSQFARLLAMGLTTSLFLYILVNVAMITGLIPVVGIPMPLVSYGGTAMLTVAIAGGLMLGLSIHRDVKLPRGGSDDY